MNAYTKIALILALIGLAASLTFSYRFMPVRPLYRFFYVLGMLVNIITILWIITI